MKNRSGWFRLAAGCFFGALLCASASAGPNVYRESSTTRPHAAQEITRQKEVKIYILSSASPIPRPISYVIGGIITTPTPIQIVGRGETFSR